MSGRELEATLSLLRSRFCPRGTIAVTAIPTATAATREPKFPSFEMMQKARRATPRSSKLSRDRSCTQSFATIRNRANEVLAPYRETLGTATHETDVTRVTQRGESGISGNDVEFPALGATTEHLNTLSYDVSEPYSFNMPEIPVDDTLGSIHDTDDKNGEYLDVTNDNNEVIVLSLSQVELLENLPPRVFVTGPPGTGKSSTLFITGSRWLGQVKDVHILSSSETSRAMSFKLQHQLQLSLRNLSLGSSGRSPQVYRHHFCFKEDEMDEAIDALVKVARDAGGQLYLLIDEAGPP
ncbi:hypothetical protein BaRGS_00030097 [Batillaria attramentaria]|uniref:Uncharacterized protein n=1 Tax=Batillaria attramentaria TaxID=370345 RepID=A0ABD0JVB2_9CAEN